MSMDPEAAAATQTRLHHHIGSKEGLTYVAATAIVGVSNFAFHVLVSRQLGPSDYGAISALLSVVTFLSIPLLALQAAVVQEVVGTDETRTSLGSLLRGTAWAALGATALLAAWAPFVASFLALGSVLPVIILSLWLTPSIGTPVLSGVLIAKLRFTTVAYALTLGAFVRLFFTAMFGAVGVGINGPIIATVLGATTVMAILAAAVLPASRRTHVDPRPHRQPLRITAATVWHTLLALGGYSLLVGIDTILARHYMDPNTAGLYASAGTAGRIALFLPMAVTTLAFPRFVANRAHPNGRRDLFLSAVIIGCIGLLAAAVMFAVPHLVIAVLFGPRFQAAAPELRVLGIEAAMLGLVSLFTYYHLSRRSPAAATPAIAAVCAVVIVSVGRPGPFALSLVMLVLATGTAVVMGVVAWFTVPVPKFSDDQRPAWLAGGGTPPAEAVELSVVMPYFNPGPRLVVHAADVLEVLRSSDFTFEVVAVSDGTTDHSDDGLDELGPELRVVRLERNEGKGEALRIGLAQSVGAYVGFIDGDGDIPAEFFARCAEVVRRDRPHFAVGNKHHPDSHVHYPWIRRVYSMGFHFLVRVLLGLDVQDTQTGLKIARHDVLINVLPLLVERGFAFDLELLAVARRFGYDRVVGVPVTIRERISSSISGAVVWTMLLDTVALAWRLRVRRSYDELARHRAEPIGPAQVEAVHVDNGSAGGDAVLGAPYMATEATAPVGGNA
jgi:O-antigen/teichoic acid export membrane protein